MIQAFFTRLRCFLAGGALAACAGRRNPGAVRRGRRAEPVHHRGPPDEALQRAAPRVREQARQVLI